MVPKLNNRITGESRFFSNNNLFCFSWLRGKILSHIGRCPGGDFVKIVFALALVGNIVVDIGRSVAAVAHFTPRLYLCF